MSGARSMPRLRELPATRKAYVGSDAEGPDLDSDRGAVAGSAKPSNAMSRARQPVQIVPKGWGREVWIANNEKYCGKILEIRKGKRCSLHYHRVKTETFFLRSGRLLVVVKENAESSVIEEFEMMPGDCMDVPSGLVHQMLALEDSELFEFSTQHFESDSHRLVRGD
jgi:mannose-6-phosphate isomerase-like protein (cupin superfamily)